MIEKAKCATINDHEKYGFKVHCIIFISHSAVIHELKLKGKTN